MRPRGLLTRCFSCSVCWPSAYAAVPVCWPLLCRGRDLFGYSLPFIRQVAATATAEIGIPMAFFGGLLLKLPIYLVYAMVMTEEVYKAAVGYIRYRQKKWLRNLALELEQQKTPKEMQAGS